MFVDFVSREAFPDQVPEEPGVASLVDSLESDNPVRVVKRVAAVSL